MNLTIYENKNKQNIRKMSLFILKCFVSFILNHHYTHTMGILVVIF